MQREISQSTPCLESCFNSILIESFMWNGRSREMYSQHYSHLLLFGNAEQMKTTASCLIIQSAEPFVWLSAVQSGATHRPAEVRDVTCQNIRNFNCVGVWLNQIWPIGAVDSAALVLPILEVAGSKPGPHSAILTDFTCFIQFLPGNKMSPFMFPPLIRPLDTAVVSHTGKLMNTTKVSHILCWYWTDTPAVNSDESFVAILYHEVWFQRNVTCRHVM